MKNETPPAPQDPLDVAATKLADICRTHQSDVLERNLQIGKCLRTLLKRPESSKGRATTSRGRRGLLIKLSEMNKVVNLGPRLLYHCHRLAVLNLPPSVWKRMKVAGLSWRQVRDVARLYDREDKAGRAKVLAALRKKLTTRNTDQAISNFQAWLDQQLNPHHQLPDDARYIVVDRESGRVFSTKLKTLPAAEQQAARRIHRAATDRIRVVQILQLG